MRYLYLQCVSASSLSHEEFVQPAILHVVMTCFDVEVTVGWCTQNMEFLRQ